jgi:hypothetical protein
MPILITAADDLLALLLPPLCPLLEHPATARPAMTAVTETRLIRVVPMEVKASPED